jgi:hypothetical protein
MPATCPCSEPTQSSPYPHNSLPEELEIMYEHKSIYCTIITFGVIMLAT